MLSTDAGASGLYLIITGFFWFVKQKKEKYAFFIKKQLHIQIRQLFALDIVRCDYRFFLCGRIKKRK